MGVCPLTGMSPERALVDITAPPGTTTLPAPITTTITGVAGQVPGMRVGVVEEEGVVDAVGVHPGAVETMGMVAVVVVTEGTIRMGEFKIEALNVFFNF